MCVMHVQQKRKKGREGECVCCVSSSERERKAERESVCVCVCCVSSSKREKDSQRERDNERLCVRVMYVQQERKKPT